MFDYFASGFSLMLLASSTCCTMRRCAGVDQIRLIKSISTARFVWSFGMNAACGHRYFLGMGSGGGGGGGGRLLCILLYYYFEEHHPV